MIVIIFSKTPFNSGKTLPISKPPLEDFLTIFHQGVPWVPLRLGSAILKGWLVTWRKVPEKRSNFQMTEKLTQAEQCSAAQSRGLRKIQDGGNFLFGS